MDAQGFNRQEWYQMQLRLLKGSHILDQMEKYARDYVAILMGVVRRGVYNPSPGYLQELTEPSSGRRWRFEVPQQRSIIGSRKEVVMVLSLYQDGHSKEPILLYTSAEGADTIKLEHVKAVYDSLPFLGFFVNQLMVNMSSFLEPYLEVADRQA